MLQAKPVYHLSTLFKKAWSIARWGAKHHGGSPRLYLAEALRQCWAQAKRTAAEIAAMRARIDTCLTEIRFSQSELGRKQAQKRMAALDAEIATAMARARAKTAALNKPAREKAA